MATPYHHAVTSQRRWGGEVEDYLPIHEWFDASKEHHGDFRHRALRHHTQGVGECERVFGTTTTLSSGRVLPTKWIAERHVTEDLGRVPALTEWLSAIEPAPWMTRAKRLSRLLERATAAARPGSGP